MRSFIVISVTLLFTLSGCASIVKQAPPGVVLPSTGDEVLVFGRIMWIQNGEIRESYSDIPLSILRAEDMKNGSIAVEKDGTFYALLPKGTYVIHEINWFDAWSGLHWIVPKVAFNTVGDRHIYYLGTLVVDLKATRDIRGGLRVKGFTIHIEDDEDNALVAFRERYPNQAGEVFKALMIHDPSIPTDAASLERKRLLDLLFKIWPVAPVLIHP